MTEHITKITMEHGSGGRATGELIDRIFAGQFQDETLDEMEDSAVVPIGPAGRVSGHCDHVTIPADKAGHNDLTPDVRLAVTTDSFVVTPIEFRGGDIGRLSVCGTVNDLLMRGAVPDYLTCGFILEEGLEIETLRRIVASMADTAREAGIRIVAGDTKVIEGNGGLYINTTGIGQVPYGIDISAKNAQPGDKIIVSGTMGDHHAAILSERLEIETDVQSDAAPLVEIVSNLIQSGIKVHTLRDVTRGGLGTVLKELAVSSKKQFYIEDDKIPVTPKVRDFCGLLGLDPLYMGNEGKLVAIVAPEDAKRALDTIRASKYGEHAAIIGEVAAAPEQKDIGEVILRTAIGGERRIDVLQGEGLPRIC